MIGLVTFLIPPEEELDQLHGSNKQGEDSSKDIGTIFLDGATANQPDTKKKRDEKSGHGSRCIKTHVDGFDFVI